MKRAFLFVLPLSLLQLCPAAYVWLGNSDGVTGGTTGPLGGDGQSLFAENNWDNDAVGGNQAPADGSINNSSQTPAGVNSGLIVNNGFVAGGPGGAGNGGAHLLLNGNPLTVSNNSGLKMDAFTGAGIQGGTLANISVNGGFVTTRFLDTVALTLTGPSSSLVLFGTTNGLTASTVNLVGSAGASPVVNWVNTASFAGVMANYQVNGVAGNWGADPFAFEAGDTLLVTQQTFAKDRTTPIAATGPSFNGFSLSIVPEPSSAGLGLLGAVALLRRRRVG